MKRILLVTLLIISCIYAQPQSFKREVMVQRQQEASPLRLDRNIIINFYLTSIYGKSESTYDENGNQTLDIGYSWKRGSFVIDYKKEYTYDANGNQTLFISYYWNQMQTFSPRNKYEYTYDENGNRTLQIGYYWNTDTQSFFLGHKLEYTYDANRNQTLDIGYRWDTSSQSFVPNYKYEYSFDTNGNQTLSTSYTWVTTTQSFVLGSKQEFTYDANGNQTLETYYNWDNGSFVPQYKYEYTYNTNGNRTLEIYYTGDTTTQSFVPQTKQEYAFDANGNQTLYTNYTWDTSKISWVLGNKKEYTYDANGNQTLEMFYYWNPTKQSIVPISKEVRTYNNGLLLSNMTYSWYSDLGVYKRSFKTEYASVLDTDTQLHRMGVVYQYDIKLDVWKELDGEEYKSYEYYTKTAALSTQTVENNSISLYPNPTSQVLYLSHPELNLLGIQIVDLNGKQMYSGTIQKDVSLDVSTYTPGMYLVTIENKEANKKNTYKIIKK